MQIFKRIKAPQKKQGQNLIEFCFVLPTLVFLTLAIFEIALFWQDYNAINSLNTEINANVALVENKGVTLGSTCPAATRALEVLEAKDKVISRSNNSYTMTQAKGTEPFALYRIVSSTVVAGNNQISLWVDCRNPFENGVTTQLEFYHKTMILSASIPRFDGKPPIEIIPKDVFISTPKLNTIRHY